ncbi:uncharacterized protein EV420DRAFT_1748665, partial [Desarmillaria tabescens]
MELYLSKSIPSCGETIGALYIGATIAAVLFGITNLQALIYYKKYRNDWWLYRCSVALLWSVHPIHGFLDALHVALSTHALYYYLIEMYGNLIGSLESNTCRLFLQGAGIIIYSIFVTSKFWTISNIKISIYTFFATVIATDLAIALIMWYYLYKSTAATDLSTTVSLLLGLLRLVLVSGLATCTCSLLTLISYVVWPKTL